MSSYQLAIKSIPGTERQGLDLLHKITLQAFREAVVKVEWDSLYQSARLVCTCPLRKGSQLSDAPLLLAQSSQRVLSTHGYEALHLLQSATAGEKMCLEV